MSRKRWARWMLAAGVGSLAACGQQAGQEYAGEPLLRLRGQAVVSALTGGQPIEPALCFFGADDPKAPQLDLGVLPADLRAALSVEGESLIESPTLLNTRLATHILDVESRGEFPAQFDIDVYQPPPSSGLSAPFVAGEPRFARGTVCAVAAEHAAVTFPFAHGGKVEVPSGQFNYAVVSLDHPRFYYEAYDCPPGTLPQYAASECSKSSAGDPNMAFEFPTGEYRSESVIGLADDLEVLYLAQAAPAGSYTAWLWGSSAGLAAGFHIFPARSFDEPPPNSECTSAALGEAEQLVNEQQGARIREALGGDFVYNGGMAYSPEQARHVHLPDDVFLAARETESRLVVQRCPIWPREELDPSTASLSIDLRSDAAPDLSRQLGIVSAPSE